MTQNPLQRLVDELADLIESQSNLRQTILDLDRRLQGLERAQIGLTHQLDELPAALPGAACATIDLLAQDLRFAGSDTRDVARRLEAATAVLESRYLARHTTLLLAAGLVLLFGYGLALSMTAYGGYLLGSLTERAKLAQRLDPPP